MTLQRRYGVINYIGLTKMYNQSKTLNTKSGHDVIFGNLTTLSFQWTKGLYWPIANYYKTYEECIDA